MTDLKDLIGQALKEFDLEEIPIASDPLRTRIAQRVFDLAMALIEEKRRFHQGGTGIKQANLEVSNGK